MTVVTFLFTDIEGSTRRWEADADAMRSALKIHDAALRECVEKYEGRLFKHTGDGVCAVFTSPAHAIDAAVAAQRVLELPVRMGIATGEAELRGGEYFGTVLNRTARVMAAGHGGQILLDGVTGALLRGADLMALGARRLRDIAQPVDLFQIRAQGLRTEFPPLKTADSTPGNLRTPTTSLIGREAELAELQKALKTHRVVTLTGVGGVGKTRLALEVAARASAEFPDGVWVVELATVGDAGAVPDAVAAALGLVQQPGMSVADSVAAALEGRRRLLVFDNCEHVLDAAAATVDAILAASETVSILATSREGLRLPDERLWPVGPLETNAGVDSGAAALFIERAEAIASDMSICTGDEAALVEICRRLDGIPLAIELAASRMQSMTVTEVRDRLDDRFRLLVGSRRGLERHQTLHHAVQWSYELLTNDEKYLLTTCSVFAGGFDLAAANALAGSSDEFVTLDLLDALVRKSLIVANRSSGTTRFSMLETIRQFAEEQLAQEGRGDEVRTAHSRYFAGKEDELLALWDGPQQREAHDWFSTELPNLRAAFRWAADRGDLDAAATIAVLAGFLGYWVEQHEAIAWSEEILEPARAAQHRRLAQLYVVAAQCYVMERRDDFVHYYQGGDAIDSGQFDEVPDALAASLHGGFMTHDPEQCIARLRSRVRRDPDRHPYSRQTLVFALAMSGATDDAIAEADDSIGTTQNATNPHLVAVTLLAYGFAYRDADPAAAYEAHRRGLELARECGNRHMATSHAVMLSRLAANHREPEEAFGYVKQTIMEYYDSGSFSMIGAPLAVLTALLGRLGYPEPAVLISAFAVDTFAAAAYPEMTTTLAHIREALGNSAFDSLMRAGKSMTNAAMVTYALEQIEQARAHLPEAGAR